MASCNILTAGSATAAWQLDGWLQDPANNRMQQQDGHLLVTHSCQWLGG